MPSKGPCFSATAASWSKFFISNVNLPPNSALSTDAAEETCASGSRSSATTFAPAANSARLCPPRPKVPSSIREPGTGWSASTTSFKRTGRCSTSHQFQSQPRFLGRPSQADHLVGVPPGQNQRPMSLHRPAAVFDRRKSHRELSTAAGFRFHVLRPCVFLLSGPIRCQWRPGRPPFQIFFRTGLQQVPGPAHPLAESPAVLDLAALVRGHDMRRVSADRDHAFTSRNTCSTVDGPGCWAR